MAVPSLSHCEPGLSDVTKQCGALVAIIEAEIFDLVEFIELLRVRE
jgi:hypothetical protein